MALGGQRPARKRAWFCRGGRRLSALVPESRWQCRRDRLTLSVAVSVQNHTPASDVEMARLPAATSARVAVLLTTHDGVAWLPQQLASLQAQRGVEVHVIASDDASTDDTREILQTHASTTNLTLLPACAAMGNANRNFLRLICEAPIGSAAYVAFCDQDDVWHDDKLARSVRTIVDRGLDAYSSDVIAFWPDGRQCLLYKAGPLKKYDYLFEPAGPGCTYVLSRAAFDALRAFAQEHYFNLGALKVHDWWIYALARVRGWRWYIDAEPTLRYRQHARNEVGANVGLKAAHRRVRNVRCGQFRRDAMAIAAAVGESSPITKWMQRYSAMDRIRLAVMAPWCRRRARDAAALAMLHLIAG